MIISMQLGMRSPVKERLLGKKQTTIDHYNQLIQNTNADTLQGPINMVPPVHMHIYIKLLINYVTS